MKLSQPILYVFGYWMRRPKKFYMLTNLKSLPQEFRQKTSAAYNWDYLSPISIAISLMRFLQPMWNSEISHYQKRNGKKSKINGCKNMKQPCLLMPI